LFILLYDIKKTFIAFAHILPLLLSRFLLSLIFFFMLFLLSTNFFFSFFLFSYSFFLSYFLFSLTCFSCLGSASSSCRYCFRSAGCLFSSYFRNSLSSADFVQLLSHILPGLAHLLPLVLFSSSFFLL